MPYTIFVKAVKSLHVFIKKIRYDNNSMSMTLKFSTEIFSLKIKAVTNKLKCNYYTFQNTDFLLDDKRVLVLNETPLSIFWSKVLRYC